MSWLLIWLFFSPTHLTFTSANVPPPLYIWDYIQGKFILHLKTHPDAVALPRSQTIADHRTMKPEIYKYTFHGTFDPKTRVLLFFFSR